MYGGTQTEMQRLIKDAAALDSSIDANSMSFANIVKAINVVQTEMGITGTTAKEAGRTIEGSVNAMKSAWTNLVTGFADKNADLEGLINNLVTTIVGDGTENNLGVIGNIFPAIETALGGISKLIDGLAPKIIELLPGFVKQVVPSLISASNNMVHAVVEVLPDLLDTIVSAIIDNAPALIVASVALIEQLLTSTLDMLPEILQLGIDLIVALLDGIIKMIDDPKFIQTLIDVVLEMVDILTNPDTLTHLLNAAVILIVALAKGIIQALPQLLAKVPEIIGNLAKALGQFLQPVIDIGKNIVDGIKKGIENAWNNLVQWFKNLFGDLIGIAKKILGIASPSKVFKKIGAFTAEGFGAGFEDAFGDVERDIENALDFGGATFGVDAYGSYSGGGALSGIGGTSFGTVNINIEGYNAQDDDELAETIAEKLQIMTERRGAVFA